MESCSSGEEVIVKARKPYTITKQRERWTEEEHNRFLEALKLYGRAWQRIEEHIGTKTAIQIRSHAQKFFTKLEKEALSKGISPGQALDIDIPPPRPKRKPTNPYPRKSALNAGDSLSKEEKWDKLASSRSSCSNVEVLESEKGSRDLKPGRTGMLENVTTIPENGTCTEVLPLFTPVSSKSGNEQIFDEVIPKPEKGNKEKTATNKMETSSDENGESKQESDDVGDVDIDRLEGLLIGSQAKTNQLERISKQKQPEKIARQSTNNVEHVENQVPGQPVLEPKDECRAVHSDARNTVPLSNQQSVQANTNTFRNPFMPTASAQETNSSASFFHQLPCFPPFFLHQGQGAYRPFLNASSTFSNLIVSNLLQNPAAHSAATAAASFWPPQDSEKIKSSVSETTNRTNLGGHANPHPGMASIAAATVAAATAWWAMHGVFPLCHPPFPTSFPFVPPATSTSPLVMASQVEEKKERGDDSSQVQEGQDEGMLGSELPEHLTLRRSESKSASSESDESRVHEEPRGTSLKSTGLNKLTSVLDAVLCESNIKARNMERKEEFYAVHNRHSGSEVTDAVGEYIQSKERPQEPLAQPASAVETIVTRCRSSVNCFNESRKEVSKEGRLAFQALFAREELPQSFSPHPPEDGGVKECTDLGVASLPIDLNIISCNYSGAIDHFSACDDPRLRPNGCLETSTSTREAGKLKPMAPRMGFKPYKRCSMEAKVGSINSEEEKGHKRLHLEGKTSNL